MIITTCHDNELLEWIFSEINKIPLWLRSFLDTNGLRLGLFNKQIQENGLLLPGETSDGRRYCNCSFFDHTKNMLFLVDKNRSGFKDENDKFSAPIHELAHAIDWVLGKRTYWSIENPGFLDIPLDSYAAQNSREQFAQTFEAYFQSDTKKGGNEKSLVVKGEYCHTIKDVFKNENKLFWLFKNHLCKA